MVKKLNYPIDKFCCTVDAVICDCCPEVDALPCDKYIKRSTEVINKLKGIKQRMFLFTNGTKCRAMKILNLIGLEDVFEKVFCADNAECDYIMKPNPISYSFVEDYLQIVDARKIHFFDDRRKNVVGAKNAGWNGYQVNENLIEQIDKALQQIEVESEKSGLLQKSTQNVVTSCDTKREENELE
ncbi:YAI5 [Enterospora canceri]|uniref:YAI5 n=1 Tax=Enterospora canceri TaxID=1081671 RepID=A0A1Y1S4F1_9MICR|nr:YAI5 [Enterospora canceri]